MKPLITNSLSAWGYVGLFILFCLPYVGTPALIICALFVPNRDVKSFARAILILTLLSVIGIVALMLFGLLSLDGLEFDVQGGIEALSNVRYLLGL